MAGSASGSFYRAVSPVSHLIGIIEYFSRRLVVRHTDDLVLAFVDKGRQVTGLELGPVYFIGLQVQNIIGDQGKHDAVVIDAVSTEHRTRVHLANSLHLLEKVFDELTFLSHGEPAPYEPATIDVTVL